MIGAQRTTDDVSDCVISQADDVIASGVTNQLNTEVIVIAHPETHEDLYTGRGAPTSVPRIAVHNGQALPGPSSMDNDDVELCQRTLSLRRRLLTADPNELVHEQVTSPFDRLIAYFNLKLNHKQHI